MLLNTTEFLDNRCGLQKKKSTINDSVTKFTNYFMSEVSWRVWLFSCFLVCEMMKFSYLLNECGRRMVRRTKGKKKGHSRNQTTESVLCALKRGSSISKELSLGRHNGDVEESVASNATSCYHNAQVFHENSISFALLHCTIREKYPFIRNGTNGYVEEESKCGIDCCSYSVG